MTPEGRIQAQLKKRVIATGGRYRKLRWVGRRSALDTFCWWPTQGYPPITAFIEVKREKGGRYEPGQEREIEGLRADGFEVFTIRSFEEIEAMLDFLQLPFDCST